ncbi:hypothetical protein NKG94_13810 [Micromonospora sp. M12]
MHSAPAQTSDGAGLVVLSVAAAPQVPPAEVLAVAYDLSAGAADGAAPAGTRSLFDLPLGATLWTVTEERAPTRPATAARSDTARCCPAGRPGATTTCPRRRSVSRLRRRRWRRRWPYRYTASRRGRRRWPGSTGTGSRRRR